jgi:hypothetical protein
MVTSNQEGIKKKDVVTIIRMGGIIINLRKMLTMIDQTIMLVRERKRSGR